MPNATTLTGVLVPLDKCTISILNGPTITLNVLPELTDSKQAVYSDATVIGRSFPLKTFSHGDNRNISMTLHLVVCTQSDLAKNIGYLRALESLVYPGTPGGTTLGTASNVPYLPPPIARIQCGKLLADGPLCAILKSYSVKFDSTVAWDEDSYLPYKFDVDLTWEVVYDSNNLPGQSRIIQTGG